MPRPTLPPRNPNTDNFSEPEADVALVGESKLSRWAWVVVCCIIGAFVVAVLLLIRAQPAQAQLSANGRWEVNHELGVACYIVVFSDGDKAMSCDRYTDTCLPSMQEYEDQTISVEEWRDGRFYE